MKRIDFLMTASAALMLWSLAPAQAAPKPKEQSSATGAETTLRQIDARSATLSANAEDLVDMTMRGSDPRSHLDSLDAVRDNINKISAALNSLEAERGSLAPWQAEALDQIVPLMNDAAENAGKAIQTYNSDRRQLWATEYVGDSAQVSKDAHSVATLLHDYLSLQKTQAKELQLERSLGEATQF